MLDAEMYRKLANDCIDRAQNTQDEDAAAGMIRLAQFWMSKADDIERKFPRAEDALAPTNKASWTTHLTGETASRWMAR
jgi:hypothetical protein